MRWLWIFLLVAAVACTPARKKARGDIVRNIGFEGNGGALSGHNDYELRTQMELESTAFGLQIFPLNYIIDPKLYNPSTLIRDAYRLEVWYAHHGWFDARVVGWRTRQVKKARRRRAGLVDIRGFVEPGAPSLVRTYALRGTSRISETIGRSVLRTGYLKQDRQYDLDSAEADRASLLDTLRQSGFAYAQVELAMDAFPEEHAVDVALVVEEGIPARIGAITIEGNENVRTRFIEQNLHLDEGSSYRVKELKAAQSRLFDMGTFSIVNVVPDLSDPTQKAVPIAVRVTENKFRSLRFGVGVESEGLKTLEPHVSVRLKHSNLFNQLIRLNLFGSVGAVAGYNSSTASLLTPIWKVSGSVVYPRIFGQRVAQQLEGKLERGVEQGLYSFDNPEVDFRTVWRPTDFLVTSLGPHYEQFNYRDIEQSASGQTELRRLFGEDFVDRYRITSVDFALTLDWRDDPLSTRRGSFFSTTTRVAFPLEEGDFSYLAFSGDWRLFRPIRVKGDVPFTWATRIHGRTLIPIAGSALPYPELVFLGGPSSLRGFPSKGVGPYETLCITEGSELVRRYFVPRGGVLGAVLSQEIRYYGAYDLTYVLFTDLGVLANPGRSIGSGPPRSLIEELGDGFRGSAGVGVRYASPIGPIRLDLAFRPLSDEDRGTASDNNTCTGHRDRRYLDAVRPFFPESDFPAVGIYFAFGEAI